jgi:hypothetical protein
MSYADLINVARQIDNISVSNDMVIGDYTGALRSP